MIDPIRRLLLRLAFSVLAMSLLGAGAQGATPEPQGPAQVRTGVYLTSLYDLNPNNNTFTADFWIWFLHDKSRELKLLKTLEPANARDFKTSLEIGSDQGMERYNAEKVHGVFNHGWDVKNFPFDQHELQIRLEEANDETRALVYVADSANTSFDRSINAEGWRIDRVAISAGTRTYDSSFGLRESTGSTYAAATVSIFVHRDALGLFWKLLAAVYIAFLISLVSFFMDPSKDGIFNGRVGLLVGMIFAVVINSQRVAATLGQSPSFTLADKIHVLTMVSILFTLIGALISRRLHTSNRGEYAARLDRRLAGCVLAVYVAANALMIVQAARAS